MAERRDLQDDFNKHFFLENAFEEWREHAAASYLALLERFHVSFEDSLLKAPTLRDTWLLRTAQKGQEAVVKLLLETGKAHVDSKDRYNRTPLLWATWNRHEAVVKLFLETGKADVDSKDAYGQTPLSCAAENG